MHDAKESWRKFGGYIDKYTIGAVENAKLAKIFYPGWKCVFYIGNDVPKHIINELIVLDCDIHYMGYGDWSNATLWRFLPASDENVDILNEGWDLMIAHPPCTHLAVSGSRWFKYKNTEQKESIDFFMELVNANIPKIAIENPISIMSTRYRKPDQIIHPWQFGHGETKATCLWLKNLPLLKPTNIVAGRESRIHKMPPSPDRWKLRSITYQGIADAIAAQWGLHRND